MYCHHQAGRIMNDWYTNIEDYYIKGPKLNFGRFCEFHSILYHLFFLLWNIIPPDKTSQ